MKEERKSEKNLHAHPEKLSNKSVAENAAMM